MSSSITNGATTLYPLQVDGFERTRATGNLLHVILNRGDVDVTFGPMGLGSGTLRMRFLTKADAALMETLLTNTGLFRFQEPDISVDFYFVPSGSLTLTLDDESREKWTLTCDFQEVLP